jgi:SAM-dependent methyltransferase
VSYPKEHDQTSAKERDQARRDSVYNSHFYEGNIARKRDYQAFADVLYSDVLSQVALVPVEGGVTPRVFDVGCGCGLICARLHEHGYHVAGFDGSTYAIAGVPENIRDNFSVADIAYLSPRASRAEIVMCMEVAEHLPKRWADHLVNYIAISSRDIIVWSAAPVGQGGVDHTNEQPPEYWLEKFSKYALSPDKALTERLRKGMVAQKTIHSDYVDNFYILR